MSANGPTTPTPTHTPTPAPAITPTTTFTWPPERFYWSVLDAPGMKRAGVLPPGLLPEFQEELPVPVEELHAVSVPTGDGRLVVCAAPRSALAELDQSLLSLTPERLPAVIAAPIECSCLNLLVGEFEPRPLRRARAIRHVLAAGVVLLAALIAVLGLVRRAGHWESVAEQARAASVQALLQISPGATLEKVLAELARLRPATEAAASLRPPPDAAPQLAALLNAWPAAIPSKPQSISVTPAALDVSVALDGNAAVFLRAFKPPPGWRLDEPRLNTAETITRVTLRMRPAEGGRP